MILWRSEEGGSERCRNRSHERRWSGFRLHRAASAGRVRPITHSTSIFAHSEFCSVACWVDTPCSLAPIIWHLTFWLVLTTRACTAGLVTFCRLTTDYFCFAPPSRRFSFDGSHVFLPILPGFPIVLYYRKNTADNKQRKWKKGFVPSWPKCSVTGTEVTLQSHVSCATQTFSSVTYLSQ